jgi:hypothetical protein
MTKLGKGEGLEAQLCSMHHRWGERLSDPQGYPNGSPFVIMVASSAVAANDLAKMLPNLNKVLHPIPLTLIPPKFEQGLTLHTP